jgi:hypothetical protein
MDGFIVIIITFFVYYCYYLLLLLIIVNQEYFRLHVGDHINLRKANLSLMLPQSSTCRIARARDLVQSTWLLVFAEIDTLSP